jgi:large subunit ribosomal protein L31
MKKNLHPNTHRNVIFKDISSGAMFLIASTVETTKVGIFTDGKEYPLYDVEVSSTTHPFYTGEQRIMDTAGRVDKFNARLQKAVPKAL